MTDDIDPTFNDGQESREGDRGSMIDPEIAPTVEGQSRTPVGCAISFLIVDLDRDGPQRACMSRNATNFPFGCSRATTSRITFMPLAPLVKTTMPVRVAGT